MGNPLNLTSRELDALRALQAGEGAPEGSDPVWDGLEQLRLVELRESAHLRVLTLAGREYDTGKSASECDETEGSCPRLLRSRGSAV
jgi:hypothetical protein